MKAIIIDDEKRSRKLLSSIIEKYHPDIEVVDEFENVPDGVIGINKHLPDLVFLDVEMPNYNGFQLLDFFQTIDFEIIFVTAYSEYAIRAFEVSAVDYILKPISLEKLSAAIEKANLIRGNGNTNEKYKSLKTNLDAKTFKRIALPVSDGLEFVETKNIICIKAEGAYTELSLVDGKRVVISKRLRFFEELLEGRNEFYRTHRSYMVNLDFLLKYHRTGNMLILEQEITIPISRDKKTDFENHIERIKL